MGYFAELQKQNTISQVAAAALLGSGVALLVFIVRLMSADFRHLGEMGWPMVLTAISAIAVVVSAKILETSLARAETVRLGADRSAA